jgi:Protein of unknown function DUF262
MPDLTPAEQHMWDEPEKVRSDKIADHEIEQKYEQGEQRIVTELNREKLPNFVHALSRTGYLNLRPFYQRRSRWDAKRQSRLIESFVMNIPVPPVFLYEKAYNQYEVMDGQQRISALQSFYDNSLRLTGLESWSELNGRTYKTLPSKVRSGLDRRSISSIVLLKESAPDEESAMLLKRIVFERLNTGGVKLGRQEIRNSLYQGKLNSRILKLADTPSFRLAWGIPDLPVPENEDPPKELADNTMFKKMEDAELILRFLALRHVENFRGGMQGFLDRYMIRSKNFSDQDLAQLSKLFTETIALATDIYGTLVFRPFDKANGKWEKQPQKSFSDAVMVGLCTHLAAADLLRQRKTHIVEATKALFAAQPAGAFTGAANTKEDVKTRISLYEEMIAAVLKD